MMKTLLAEAFANVCRLNDRQMYRDWIDSYTNDIDVVRVHAGYVFLRFADQSVFINGPDAATPYYAGPIEGAGLYLVEFPHMQCVLEDAK